MEELIVYTDGAARGNPGPAAIGVQICGPDEAPLEEFGEVIGRATNNVAEYTAIIRALERARALGARRVTLRADSELAVRQLTGVYQVKNEGLLPLFRQARRLLASFDESVVEHIPRERNRTADALANRALDAGNAPGRQPPPDTSAPPSTPPSAPPTASVAGTAGRSGGAVRRIQVLQVDAFTTVPFGGNPAGVVPDASGLSDEEMQAIAREMNLSETAFVLPPQAPGADFRVRFFTPRTEVDLCGHATVAAFWALAELGRLAPAPGAGPATRRQETRAGVFAVEVRFDGGRPAAVMMSQAVPRFRPFSGNPAEVAGALGLRPEAVAADAAAACAADSAAAGVSAAFAGAGLPLGLAYTGLWHLMVPVRGLQDLQALAPDMSRLGALNERLGVQTTHVYTTETLAAGRAAHARSFAPVLGISEDPQTGTACGALAAFLVAHGILAVPPSGVVSVVIEQGHFIGRPGEVQAEVHVGGFAPGGTPRIDAVRAGGPAVIVLEGALRLPTSSEQQDQVPPSRRAPQEPLCGPWPGGSGPG